MQTAVFKITPPIKRELVKIVDARIKEAHVTKEDFSALKNIVKELGVKMGELASAQKRTEIKVEELAEAQKRTENKVEELAEAQKRTENKVEELAEAQKRTEGRLEELTTAQKELTEAQKRTEMALVTLAESMREMRQDIHTLSKEVGGLGKSFGYALENESYRHLPDILRTKYGIEVKEKIIRAHIGGREINLFCPAFKDGREVLIVGEARTKLDVKKEQPEVFAELEEKVQAVLAEHPQAEIVRVVVTHFASNSFLDKAKAQGIIVVQSFEW
jgi:DNA repair exonuclease SbcCD ATPase subunit